MGKNPLELLFDYTYDVMWNDVYFLVREVDFPLYLIQQSKLRYKPKQMVDRILLSRTRNIAIEMKHSQTKSIALDRLAEHQVKYLTLFQEMCGHAYFLLAFNHMQEIWLIPIQSYHFLLKTLQVELPPPKGGGFEV